jgi:hypothetical protein
MNPALLANGIAKVSLLEAADPVPLMVNAISTLHMGSPVK